MNDYVPYIYVDITDYLSSLYELYVSHEGYQMKINNHYMETNLLFTYDLYINVVQFTQKKCVKHTVGACPIIHWPLGEIEKSNFQTPFSRHLKQFLLHCSQENVTEKLW